MKLVLIRKKKGRRYTSEDCAREAAGVTLAHDPAGRPYAEAPEGLFVSVSDTKNWWGMLTASTPCGLDLEENSRNLTAATAKKLHPLEQQYLEGLQPLSREWKAEFLSIWVRKEAYVKYCGEGLRMGLAKFSVLDEALEYAPRVQAKDRPEGYVFSLDAAPELTAAAVLQKPEELESVELCSYAGAAEKDVLDEAADLLTARSYFRKDLEKKLQAKGYSREEAEDAAARLQELGYLDDEAFAKDLAAEAARKGKGKLRIQRELSQKGADAQSAKAALEAVQADEEQLSERERAMEEAQKLLRGTEHPDEKTLARVGRRLSALGYEPSVIWDVLGKLRD